MSTPPFLKLPDIARALWLDTKRGEFAAHEAVPPSGATRGTALLVPGFTGSKEDFIALLKPLALAGYRVVAVDQRGQYETPGPADRAEYTREKLALDVVAMTEALAEPGSGSKRTREPVHLVGHSFGGLVCRSAVIEHGPERWASLTLMSSGPAAIAPGEVARLRMLVDALGVYDLETIWQAKQELEEPKNTPETTDPEIEDFLRERWLTTVPEQLAAAGEQLMTEPDRVAELAAVPLPKLVLSGEEDYAWPVTSMDDMARRLEARRVIVEGAAGHSPNAERPKATAAALAEFWGTAAG